MTDSMKPLGKAIKDYFDGNRNAVYTTYRDDGKVENTEVSMYFRSPEQYFLAEKPALDYCYGNILVVGAGAGAHSLVLQGKGFNVLAIDISRDICNVLKKRGQKNVLCKDFIDYNGGLFDTVCFLGRNIGMAGTLDNLNHYLNRMDALLKPGGLILMNSYDLRISKDPLDIEYVKKNEESGKYSGEVKYRLEYKKILGNEFNWLYIDFDTLKNYTEKSGWNCEIIVKDNEGDYLARIFRH